MTVLRKQGLAWFVCVGVLIAGCTPMPPTKQPTFPEFPQDGAASEEQGEQSLDPRERAVAALLVRADTSRREGKFDAAVADIERALRILPRDPRLWQRLAQVRLEQGKFYLAEQLAAKSNALAGQDDVMRMGNWRIIAQARELRGDVDGARVAYDRAAAY